MFVLPTHLFAVLQFCLAPCLSRLEAVSGCCDVDEGLTWQVLCWWSGVRRYIEPEKVLKERQTFDITHQASLTVCGFIQSYQQHRTPSQTNTQWHAQWHPHKKSTRSTTALREGRVVSSGVPQQVSICVLRARKQSGVIFPCMLAAYWIHAIFFSAHVYICLYVNMSASESLKFYAYKKCFLYKCACCHHKTVLCDFEKLRAKKKKKGTLRVILWKDFWPHSSHYCNSTHHFNVLTARFWSKTTSLYKNLHIYHVTHRYFFS